MIVNIIIKEVIRKLYLAILLMLAFPTLFFCYNTFFKSIQYEAQSSVLFQMDDSNQGDGYKNLLLLSNTYSSILDSPLFFSDIVEQLKEDDIDISTDQLKSMLTVTSSENSLVFNMMFKSTSRAELQKISKAYIDVLNNRIPQLFPNVQLIVLENSQMTKEEVSVVKYIISIILAWIIYVFCIILEVFLKNKIYLPEQVSNAGIIYLGEIPFIKNVESSFDPLKNKNTRRGKNDFR